MNSEGFRLERKTFPPRAPQSTEYLSWAECLGQYGSDTINSVWNGQYAKTAAIHNLHQAVQSGHYVSAQAQECVRAILTDRGLLFPQTRERYETEISHSMKRHLCQSSFYRAACSKADGQDHMLNRVLSYAKKIYDKRRDGFEEDYPLISFNRVQDGIQALLDGWDGPFSTFHLISDDVGCYKGKLSTLSYAKEPLEVERVMANWLDTVYFQFGDLASLQAGTYLKETLGFTTIECYEFLAYILPQCIREDALYRTGKKLSADYTPVLSADQEHDYSQQVTDFKQEDLTCWKNALPALKQYLAPDLDRFERDYILSDIIDESMSSISEKLEQAFSQYLNHMEPRSYDTAAVLAKYFVSSCTSEGIPLFLDQPGIIFHLLRSPVHRYFYQAEDRGWNLKRVVYEACVLHPLPVTQQSLAADEALFYNILAICTDACESSEVDFLRDPWDSLWNCIRQSVQCLPFQKEDLFSVQYQFRGLLKFHEKGYPALDNWLEQRLTAQEAPAYIALWRTLVNKLCSPSHKRSELLQESIDTYRSIFESPTANDDNVWDLLEPLCSKISWNKVNAAPKYAEIKSVAALLSVPSRARGGTFDIIKSGRMKDTKKRESSDQTEDTQEQKTSVQTEDAEEQKASVQTENTDEEETSVRAVELVLMEWLFLQCVCQQAGRELMETVVWLLSEEIEGPA